MTPINQIEDAICRALASTGMPEAPSTSEVPIYLQHVDCSPVTGTIVPTGAKLLSVIVASTGNVVLVLERQIEANTWAPVATIAGTVYRTFQLVFPIPVPITTLRWTKTTGGAVATYLTMHTST